MALKFCFRLPKTPRPADLGDGLVFSAEPSKGTVILIHGLTGTPNEMKFLATHLRRNGYSVLCPRLAWHGEPLYILKRLKWQQLYQSVKEALLKIPADQTIFAGGLSMGALLALLLAEEFPDRISGVTCFSPTLFYDGWNTPWTRHLLLPLAYYTPFRYFAYHKEEPPYGIKNERVRQKVHQYYQKATLSDSSKATEYGYPYIPGTLFYELRKVIKFLEKKLSCIQTPVQLVQAYEDDMTSIKNSQFIYGHIGSRQKEIVYLYNSYHVITADQERDEAAQKMFEFFERIRSSGGGLETDCKEEESNCLI